MAALVDRLECGLIACDASGRVLHMNAAAHRALAQSQSIWLVDGQLRCKAAQQHLWSEALSDAAMRQRRRLVHLEEDGGDAMVAVMPLDEQDGGERSVLVMMGRRQVCTGLGLEMLSSHHGLTFAESRVLRALVNHSSPREIALAHGVGMATIRTQIRMIRDKFGVRSIDALLLRAAEMPPVASRI